DRAGRSLVRRMYEFARRPKWILSHLFVLVLVAAMVVAGLWQLDRLQQKKDRNALVEERLDEPVAPVEEVVGAEQPTDEGDDVRFRRATATGTYLVDEQVLVRNRSFDGAPGSWVLTPLVLDDGSALVVNRGWVPVTAEQPVPAEAAPPTGEVAVEGLLEASQERGSFGPTDPSGEELATLSRVDLDRLQEQVDEDLYPVWLQLEAQDPAQGDRPTMLERPDLSEGPHLSYAVQWFTFTLIALVGYPLVLRRRARQGEPEPVPA
ncbi:MAG TPA: SURF1 family protein, partial [Acidimicrobiales bacterium]|nr:SURF1 family protein [Acidimicrobiales bacterium]